MSKYSRLKRKFYDPSRMLLLEKCNINEKVWKTNCSLDDGTAESMIINDLCAVSTLIKQSMFSVCYLYYMIKPRVHWSAGLQTSEQLRSPAHTAKARPAFPMYSLWRKAEGLGVECAGWVSTEGRIKVKKTLFKNGSALSCTCSWCVLGERQVCCIFCVSEGPPRIFCPSVPPVRPAFVLLLFSPSSEPLSSRSSGRREQQLPEAVWDPEGLTSDLNVTAPCHQFILNLTQQYERAHNRACRINAGACSVSSLNWGAGLGWSELL